MKKLLSIALATAGFAHVGFGQASPSPDALPPGPLVVQRTPGTLQWTVDFTYGENPKPEKAAARERRFRKLAEEDPALAKAMDDPQFQQALDAPRLKRLVITKTGDLRHEERFFEGGQKAETWRGADFRVEKKINLADWSVSLAEAPPGDFPEFNWVSRANFTRIETTDDRKVAVFEQKLDPVRVLFPQVSQHNAPPADEELLVPVTAKIDMKMHLPVSLEIAGDKRVYTFPDSPPLAIVMPPEVAAALQETRARIQEQTRPLSRP